MLNPELFKLLERRFGEGEVQIVHEDIEMSYEYKLDLLNPTNEPRYKIVYDVPGEQYIVKCPFCRDWRPRLYINHRWGVADKQTRNKNLWMAYCWNENCLGNYVNQLSLYEQVVEYYQIGPITLRLAPVRSDKVSRKKPKPTSIPPGSWPLDDMKHRSPLHDAITYVEDRLWNPVYLGEKYGVCYCLDSYFDEAKNRLIAPVTLDGRQVGWQARYIGDPPVGTAKWWTCPGFSIGSALYNYDGMKQYQTKVIVEGPADVWSFGPQACGIFNKNMTGEQRRLFAECFNEKDVGVILLDPQQDAKTAARKEIHHIDKLYQQLTRESKLQGRIIKVYLPDGCDPDELDREYMRNIIHNEAQKQNLTVSFAKQKEVCHA